MSSLNEPLISIVIPVYNVEKYLRACIDSIIKQSFKEYEIILIDDGSLDSSPSICDEYADKNACIKVIHKVNKGVSDARNQGMLSAVGKYILFIDSDDFIGEDSLAELVETIKKDGETDLILLNSAYCYNDGDVSKINNPFKKNMLYKKKHGAALKYLTSLPDFTTSACLKLIKRELLISNGIFFDDKIAWGEDTDFCIRLYLCARSYNYCGSYIYYYRKDRKGSATYSFTRKDYKDLLHIISKWTGRARDNIDYNKFSKEIYSYFAFQYCMLISGFNKIGSKARRIYKAETKKYSWLLKKSNDKRVLLVGIVYNIFGLRLTSIALCIYEKVK